MNTKQIKKFFKAYGYDIHVRVSREDKIVMVCNDYFMICVSNGEFEFLDLIDNSSYFLELTDANLFFMIIDGFILTGHQK